MIDRDDSNEGTLTDQVALVAGATRGAGRGIAIELGARGATVYCTGRSVRGHASPMRRPETIEETAELVEANGGVGIPVQVDHSDSEQVTGLMQQISNEQDGRLDILVNDVWGGDPLTEWDKPFWKHSLKDGLAMQRQAIWTHLITAWHAAPLMVARKRGLIIEMTDGETQQYRGSLFYDLVKASVIRLAFGMSEELRQHNVAVVAVTPGFMRSEAMLDIFKVSESNWRDAIKSDPHFAYSETPRFVGRGIAALAADTNVLTFSGETLTSWGLAQHYNFDDIDGNRPDWGTYFATLDI